MVKAKESLEKAFQEKQLAPPDLLTRSEESLGTQRHFPSFFHASPFSLFRLFSEEMERRFQDFGFWRRSENGSLWPPQWSPQVEMFEEKGKLVIRAELPGVKKDEIQAEITDSALIIQGERRDEQEKRERSVYRSERSYGSFYRRIPLPEGVDGENATAKFRDGVLEIEVKSASRPEQRSRRLEIRT